MRFRRLGKSEVSVSVVGIGTWQFGGEWGKKFKPKEVGEIFEAARDLGINLIDTAECYGDHTSEKLIGKAIKPDRDRWVVATKFGHKFNGFLSRSVDYSAKGMVSQLEKSLRALKTDWIDVYQVHGVSRETYEDDALWTALEKQQKLGKIRLIGVSIGHDPTSLGRDLVQTVQVHYNRLELGAEKEVLPLCLKKDLGVLARVPLASGFLSGKYKPGHRWGKGDVRKRIESDGIDTKLGEVQRIQKEEVFSGTSMAIWALHWCLRHPAVTAVIPGCKSVEQIRANGAAAELLTNQETHPQAVEVSEVGTATAYGSQQR
ncbi:aldo/keto reductase [candidate division KSB1 bacterium]|nr:aldo/keto reductase [candidate division KSB1 bacterium]NIR72964.1 aldo/keto reductase [candidate division KSB1 bacterium]NIS25181.1 aldo/keto reductase [candidate division KSB1 bacterium]NIT72084.1 aldo/keto reductase [candidate division KSB1 bacterium]NIU25884.1 aldo/keto reductase [candidate division KSB1 bacterium]